YCNVFAIAVARRFDIKLSGKANHIFSQMQKSPGISLGRCKSGAQAAAAWAEQGWLVVAASYDDLGSGDPNQGHGHVAIVVARDAAGAKKNQAVDQPPLAFWGNLGGTPHQNESITW